MKSLAFQIVNDLLFAKVIIDDVSPGEVQNLVQARLSQDKRFRGKIVHLAHTRDHRYAGEPVCHQVGHNLNMTHDPTQVTCLRCLDMYCMRGLAAKIERTQNKEQKQPVAGALLAGGQKERQ